MGITSPSLWVWRRLRPFLLATASTSWRQSIEIVERTTFAHQPKLFFHRRLCRVHGTPPITAYQQLLLHCSESSPGMDRGCLEDATAVLSNHLH